MAKMLWERFIFSNNTIFEGFNEDWLMSNKLPC